MPLAPCGWARPPLLENREMQTVRDTSETTDRRRHAPAVICPRAVAQAGLVVVCRFRVPKYATNARTAPVTMPGMR